MGRDIGVLIVDDSSIVRQVLSRELAGQPGIRVLGAAPDGVLARKKIAALRPDVVTLDIEMPRMDGLTFLRWLMRHHPVPVIVVSSLTARGTDTALACLEAGAIDVVAKPGEACSVSEVAERLGEMIRGAADVRLAHREAGEVTQRIAPAPPLNVSVEAAGAIVALGASTGGTEALRRVLTALPVGAPPVAMTLHMPKGFTRSFAERLNAACAIEVREACDGDRLVRGVALLAPGDRHLRVVREGGVYVARVSDGPRVCRHRPSVDVLFESVATAAGPNALGVIMTGMGNDGAAGLLEMRRAGGTTLAQDEASCVVFGMPREAIRLGGAQSVEPLEQIIARIATFRGVERAAA